MGNVTDIRKKIAQRDGEIYFDEENKTIVFPDNGFVLDVGYEQVIFENKPTLKLIK